MSSINYSLQKTVCIGLGGNISSHVGSPQATLIAARPVIEKAITNWTSALPLNHLKNSSIQSKVCFRWSPLYKTKPIGGPKEQPSFINTVLIVHGGILNIINPSEAAAKSLLNKFLSIEKRFGRNRNSSTTHWGPRSLDIDMLTWGGLQLHTKELTLPHPYLTQREFVIIPLAAAIQTFPDAPIQIPAQPGWCE